MDNERWRTVTNTHNTSVPTNRDSSGFPSVRLTPATTPKAFGVVSISERAPKAGVALPSRDCGTGGRNSFGIVRFGRRSVSFSTQMDG